MSVNNFRTENNTLRKLLGNGLFYEIPRFQRDYSWDLSHWEDLWNDILTSINEEKTAHYMGYLVLLSKDDKHFFVIDGQQRLTTITIIILAALKALDGLVKDNIDAENNKKRINQIQQTYIGYIDPVTLISNSKLTLNRNNNDYFQNYIIPRQNLPKRGFRSSEHLLRQSFEWFDRQINQYVKNKADLEKGSFLAQFIEDLSDNLFFTVITVTDELNAYKVFETLNARGVKLSSTDLLKNYLFSILDKKDSNIYELRKLEERWENLVNRLQAEKFPDFLRVHWNSRHKFARHTELFKVIRNFVKNREDAFNLLKELDEDVDIYINLTSPEGCDWDLKDKININILKMFRVRQHFSLILAARRTFSSQDFSILLNAIKSIAFRYNTIGNYSPTEEERTYSSIAQKIALGEIKSLKDVWSSLKPIYIDDQRFVYDFSEKTIKTTDSRANKIVRYILCEIEKQLQNTALDFNSDRFNIEHILPQNADDNWGDFSNEEADIFLYRLGNMVLLSTSENKTLGNLEYSKKRKVLLQSSFKLTSKIADLYEEWSPEAIVNAQKFMAQKAKTIWKVSQLESE